MAVCLQGGAGPFLKFVVFTGPLFVCGTPSGCPAIIFITGDITVLTRPSTGRYKKIQAGQKNIPEPDDAGKNSGGFVPWFDFTEKIRIAAIIPGTILKGITGSRTGIIAP